MNCTQATLAQIYIMTLVRCIPQSRYAAQLLELLLLVVTVAWRLVLRPPPLVGMGYNRGHTQWRRQ